MKPWVNKYTMNKSSDKERYYNASICLCLEECRPFEGAQ